MTVVYGAEIPRLSPESIGLDVTEYTPPDKSIANRFGMLALQEGDGSVERNLATQPVLSDDLQALHRALGLWHTDAAIDVGESGTLYRFLLFGNWMGERGKQFITQGTLRERPITLDPSIIHLSPRELLEIDETSQWASAAVLWRKDEPRLADAPYKLQLTYKVVDYWQRQKAAGQPWQMPLDYTIQAQAEAFVKLLTDENAPFIPRQAEDYCFARAFGYVTQAEGKLHWPSLRGHESNRLEEMERALAQADNDQPVDSRDHRVVQAMAMLAIVDKRNIRFFHPNAVKKSWPRFWELIEAVSGH